MNRRRAEEALRRSEYNLAEAQRLAQTGSFVWDVKTKQALYLSDEWYRIYGFDRAVDKAAWDERLSAFTRTTCAGGKRPSIAQSLKNPTTHWNTDSVFPMPQLNTSTWSGIQFWTARGRSSN